MEIHASSCFPSRRKFLFDILEKIRLETRIFKNIIFLRYLATLWLSIWYVVFFFIFRIDRASFGVFRVFLLAFFNNFKKDGRRSSALYIRNVELEGIKLQKFEILERSKSCATQL